MDSMDRFVSRENVKRYRRLAGASIHPSERLQILKLLAEEEAKFKFELSRETNPRMPITRQYLNHELILG